MLWHKAAGGLQSRAPRSSTLPQFPKTDPKNKRRCNLSSCFPFAFSTSFPVPYSRAGLEQARNVLLVWCWKDQLMWKSWGHVSSLEARNWTRAPSSFLLGTCQERVKRNFGRLADSPLAIRTNITKSLGLEKAEGTGKCSFVTHTVIKGTPSASLGTNHCQLACKPWAGGCSLTHVLPAC